MEKPYLKKSEIEALTAVFYRQEQVSLFPLNASGTMSGIVVVLPLLISLIRGAVITNNRNDKYRYIDPTSDEKILLENRDHWLDVGRKHLERNLRFDGGNKGVAKNVIVLIGDGMGISTITSTRIYQGQREFGKSGEEHSLAYDSFPNVGLVKTYNVDKQVPDSAGTATALFTGVKTRYGALGVDVNCNRKTFDKATYEASKLESIMTWAQRAGKDTGIITTTRITHATPAATYAQVNDRDWECDSEVPQAARPFVKDIARQLFEDAPGKHFKVIMGGGFQQLGYTVHNLSSECIRTDGRNLTKTWLENHRNDRAKFVTSNGELREVDENVDYLLGVFDPDHLPYEIERERRSNGTPSLQEMVEKALPILKRNQNGFVLLIEGGRIDHGHHKNYARAALEESSQFEKTIRMVVEKCESDTLIIVTADHSHTLTLNGYSKRGNDILGYDDDEEKPALTLSYANGPGFTYHYSPNEKTVLGPWIDVRNDSNHLNNPKYQHLATYRVKDESHAGEDVGIYATGPSSHLIRGVMEQNYVADAISYAACIGPRAAMNPYCQNILKNSETSQFSKIHIAFGVMILLCLLFI